VGLAPYGKPVCHRRILAELIDVKADGSFRLDWTKFEFIRGEVMTGEDVHTPVRRPAAVAGGAVDRARVQPRRLGAEGHRTDRSRLAKTARELTGERHLCMAGGVAPQLRMANGGGLPRAPPSSACGYNRPPVTPAAPLRAALLSDRRHRQVAARTARERWTA
jgi:carbamoyltransferase